MTREKHEKEIIEMREIVEYKCPRCGLTTEAYTLDAEKKTITFLHPNFEGTVNGEPKWGPPSECICDIVRRP